jgi:hypothetical protein
MTPLPLQKTLSQTVLTTGLRMNLTIAPLDAIVFNQAFLEKTFANATNGFSVYCLLPWCQA